MHSEHWTTLWGLMLKGIWGKREKEEFMEFVDIWFWQLVSKSIPKLSYFKSLSIILNLGFVILYLFFFFSFVLVVWKGITLWFNLTLQDLFCYYSSSPH